MEIRRENAKLMREILEKIGPEDAMISNGSDWELCVYRSEETEEMLTVEMCLRSEYGGDPLFDPLMRIELALDNDKVPVEARCVYYLSRTLFYTEEIYSAENPDCYDPKLTAKADELDPRLAEWLKMLKAQRYIPDGAVTPL